MASSWSLNNWQQQEKRQKHEKRQNNAETTSLDTSLDDWMRTQPLSVLQLDPADRAVLKVADERDAVQKKTFTKWVNKHLKKAGKNIEDLFIDLQDGHNLISLLEVLSSENLKREKGRMRIHRLQNVQTCLDFLDSKSVTLVNIQAADIVDGNPKLTLGLIWKIILHFQVSEIAHIKESGLTAKDALTQWARRVTEGYPGVNIRDLTASWRDGLAFNAILHKYKPDIINWREVRSRMNSRQRLENAFGVAEREFGVTKLLDPEDVEVQLPDEKSMMTYISTLYDALPDRPAAENYDRDINDYRMAAREFLHWVHRSTRTMQDRSLPVHVAELKQLLTEMERFQAMELPIRLREKEHLEQIYLELEKLFADTTFMRAIEDDLTVIGLNQAWNNLLAAISEREQLIMEKHGLQGNAQDAVQRLQQQITVTNEKLDLILARIEETESRARVTSPRQLKETFDGIILDLNLLEGPIDGFFRDVEILKASRHPQANEYYKLVFGLHQRRIAYLERCGVIVGPDGKFSARSDFYMSEEYFYTRETLFKTVEESIEWIERRLKELSEMPFVEDLRVLEEHMEKHKVEHRNIMDFRHQVDQCISHQAKVSAEDSGPYCDLLHSLEEAYAQLRELSTGRVLDLDSLIAFIRAAQLELLWINEREELEVSRNWSDVGHLDLPMLQNYYKQLMHEIELREEQFNAVHNQGAALINQGHPAVYVIEAYLTTMQAQWDWLLSLTQCLEVHLQDALNVQQFMEDAQNCEQWMEKQVHLISTHYERGDFSLDEGEHLLHELDEIREMLDRYHEIVLSLYERSRIISPLWQRGERISRPLPVTSLCNYQERNTTIRKNDECVLMDNSDMIKWLVRTPEGVEGVVPSVVFRLPPPDEQLLSYLQRLQAQFDRLRRLWSEKHRIVRYTMILNTMRTIRAWDLKQFMALDPERREAIIKAMNDDTSKLLTELDPNDPLALRLRDELHLTNEHFYKLLQAAQRGPEPEISDKFDERIIILLQQLEDAWRNLNDRVAQSLPRDMDTWEIQIHEHKAFEDSLQALDSDVSMVQELYRQLKEASPMQRARMDQLLGRWEDLWELSRMTAERLKALEFVLNGLTEAVHIVSEHEITLASFNTMPAKLDELRAVHSQLLEIQLTLQQQQPIMDDLASNIGLLRQHVARTRSNVTDHPDVDRLEDEVQRATVRWENICMQVIERLKSAELSLQSLMIYRSAYENELTWLDRVESTIRQLRNPEDLKPDEYQEHLDILLAEYSHLNERTQAMENVNLEGGKFIRDAKVYDIRISQFKDLLEDVHKGIDARIRRTVPPPVPGADVVSKELEELNKRFAQLSSFIYQRRNDLQLLMQKYQQKQLEEEDRVRHEERKRRAEEERQLQEERQRFLLEKEQRERLEEERRRKKALEDLEKERLREEREREMQRLRELEEERERLQKEEAERRKRERDRAAEEEKKRREDEEKRRREREEAERRRREEEERRLWEREEAERRKREEEHKRRLDDEMRKLEEEERRRREDEERRRLEEERRRLEDEARRRREREEDERRQREREQWQREHVERTRVDIPIVKETFVSHKHITPPPVESKTVTKTVMVAPEPKRPEIQFEIQRGQQWREGVVGDTVQLFDETIPVAVDATLREHEDDVIMYAEETEQRTKFYELEAIRHMQTGEILTFVEAVRQGLLDLRSGEFFDIVSGSRISLEEAVERGYISQSFNDCLQTHYGIKDPTTGEDLTMFEAIQRGLYDPECRQLRDPSTGELMALYEASRLGVISMDNVHRLIKMGILKLPPLHLEQAIEQKVVDLESGQFIGRFSRETLPLKEALHNGYITISSPLTPMIAITLTECIEKHFIDANSGEFSNKHTGEKFSLRDAVSKQNNLVNVNVREVVNTSERKRITLGDALLKNIINSRQGNYTDTAQHQNMSLLQAYENVYIQKPMTLKSIVEKDLIDSLGHFIDSGTKKRMTLLEAVAEGLLDPDVPHIVDPNEKEIISLAEALERGLMNPRGFFLSPETNEEYTVHEANKRGILSEPLKFTVFDVKGIKNTKTNQMVSFNEALELGIIQIGSGRFVDLATNETFLLEDTVEKAHLLDPMLHMILSAPAGIKNTSAQEINVFNAIVNGLIDTQKGAIVNKQNNTQLDPKQAYEQGLLDLKGALRFSALFNVHPSLIAVTKIPKIRRKRIHPRGASGDRVLKEGETRIKLSDALRQGLVDARAQRFRIKDREITLQDALNQGLVDPSAEWIVPDRGSQGGPTVQESITEQMTETSQVLAPSGQTEETITTVKRLRTKETTASGGPGGVAVYRAITSGRGSLEVPVNGLHIFAAEREGLFDTNTGILTLPNVDRSLTFEEALELGVLNPKQFTVHDTKSGAPLSINEAIETGLIDSTGHVRDHKTSRFLSLQAAIDAEIVTITPEITSAQATKVIQFGVGHQTGPVMSITPIGTSVMEESEASFSFDVKTGEIVDGHTRFRISLDEAVRTGKVDKSILRAKDALTDREMSYADAVKWGIIDKQTDRYVNKRTNKMLSLQEAAVKKLVFVTGGIPEFSKDAVRTDVRQQTRKIVTTKEAAIAGPAAFVDYSLPKIIELGWYDDKTGLFTHPDTKKQMTLKQAIIKGLFNPYESVVINSKTGAQISLLDAVQSGTIDAEKGTILDEGIQERMSLKAACERGIIRSGILAQTLETAISSGRLDISTGEIKSPENGEPLSLHEAISRGIIDPNSIVVKDPSSAQEMPFLEAVREKVVDLNHGVIINKRTGDGVSLTQAVLSGIVYPIHRPGAVQTAMTVSHIQKHNVKPDISLGSTERLVDLGGNKQVMVKVIKDEQGVEKGEYIDPSTGMKFTVRLHADPYTTQMKTSVKSTAQVQSIDLEPYAELIGIDKIRDNRTGREITLADAQRLGIARVNKHGKQTTKTYAVFRSDLSNALKSGVIDSGRNEHVSLPDAIKSRLIDIRDLVYVHPQTNERIDFVQAANMGLLDVTLAEVLPKGVCNPANGERISISRAIELKIIDPKSGAISNPFTKDSLTWLDVLKPVYASMTMEGIYDPRKGYAVPILSAINENLIDMRSNEYHNPITNERYSLEEASKIGLIDEATYKAMVTPNIIDWRSGKSIHLLEAIKDGIVDPQHRSMQISKGVIMPISKAIEEGKIAQDIGERLRRVDKLTFAEALGRGLIDVRSNQYTDLDTGRRMTVAQALQEGYIDTGSVESQEGMDERNLCNVIDSYEFDESSGRIRDQKTGLYLTFREAVDRDVIDGDSLICDVDTGRTMTLRSAINLGLINSDGKYVDKKTGAKLNLKDAVRVGQLALIPSPMLASQAFTEAIKRREKEGFKFKIERPTSPKSPSGQHSSFSDEIGEKYTACGTSIDGLTSKLRENREDILRLLSGPGDVTDGSADDGNDFQASLLLIKEKELAHRNLGEDVKLALKTAQDLTSPEGAAVLSPEEFHNLRKKSDDLKREYDDDSLRLQKILNRLTVAATLKEQYDAQVFAFRAWMDQTNNALGELLSAAVDPAQISLCQKRCRDISDDTSGHRSELDAITNLARQIQDEVNGYIGQVVRDDDTVSTNVPAFMAVKSESEELTELWHAMKDRCQLSHHQLEDAKNFFVLYDQLKSWLNAKDKLIAVMGPIGVDTTLINNQLQQTQVLLDEFESQNQNFIEFRRCGNSLLSALGECEHVNVKIQEISDRYDALVNDAKQRREKLQNALELAEQWGEHYPPLLSWLDNAERRLQKEYVSVDAERMASQIDDHKNLHEEIEGHRPLMDNVFELGTQLKRLLADDEADQVEQQLVELVTRYDQLGNRSLQVGEDLFKIAQGLDDFLTRTDELGFWLDDVGLQVQRFNSLSAIPDSLESQMQELMALAEEINDQEQKVSAIIEEGRELCKHTRGDEAVALQTKLDSLRWRYSELNKTVDTKLGMVQEIMPLAEAFDTDSKMLGTWLTNVETDLSNMDDAMLDEKHVLIENIVDDISQFRKVLNDLTMAGARLSQLCPDDATAITEGTVVRLQKRFENVEDQVRKKGEQMSRILDARSDVVVSMDDLVDWFQQAEAQILEAGAAPASSIVAKKQLQDQKLLHADVGSQRTRSRETISNAKKLLKDIAGEEAQAVEDKIEVLKELSDYVHRLSSDRLSVLEQAVPLADYFDSTYHDLAKWLEVLEKELEDTPFVISGLHPEQLRKYMEHNKVLQDSIQENKPLLDNLNKSGTALSELCNSEDANRISDMLDQMNGRFEGAREQARSRGNALTSALQQSLEVTDQLDNMLDSLAITADRVRHPEPVAAHPDRIREQVQDNSALMDELEQKHDAYLGVLAAAEDILRKADPSDPAVSEIKGKMDNLTSLWNEILATTESRGRKLDDTLAVAQRFWDELRSCEQALKNLQNRLDSTETPACEPEAVDAQRADLADVEAALHDQAPRIDACREAGQKLIGLVGDQEKPELQQQIDGLNNAWETVTAAFHRRHDNLVEAMEKAMKFHEMFHDVVEYLSNAEQRFHSLEPISSNLLELQEQIEQVAAFKGDLDKQSIVLQQLNHECDQLAEGRTYDQAGAVKRPMQELNRRWDYLSAGLRQRRDKLDEAYVKAGHFQQALDQVLDWMEKTDRTLDEIKPVPGDLKQTEIEIAKHKVLQNDVHSRQTSINTLNDAGRKLLAAHADADPKGTQQKLDTLNTSWSMLLEKLAVKAAELEACKGDAAQFGDQVQYWLHWLSDADDFLSTLKTVGGLPETTKAQLDSFMAFYEELKLNQPKVESVLCSGDEYASKSPENAASTLSHQVKLLKQRWDAIMTKANDRKTKLEIAHADAIEFNELMNQFVEWLMNAEQYLNGLPQVSRLIDGIQNQMSEHTQFREEVNAERAVALELNEKGTKLKYYCQKQDVILIKNLLVSTQHRWDKVVSRTADRTKQLDNTYNDVREFYTLWNELCNWCDDSVRQLEETRAPGRTNKPERIRENLNQHKEFQTELGNRQQTFDATMKLGKQLKDHAPKSEQPAVQDMLNSLRDKWNELCNRSIDRQRELEEDLLLAGQFKEAVDGLLKWLSEVEPTLSPDAAVCGDIDTVTGLVDRHRNFMAQLKSREVTVETVRKAGEELLKAAENPEIESQMADLNAKWDHVKALAGDRETRLMEAKAVAEKFYHGAHATLEWLSEMETKVKYAGSIPDDEESLNGQLEQLKKLQEELSTQKTQLDNVLTLGNDIMSKCHADAIQPMKQWMTILQARWDEVGSWAQERESRLRDQLNAVREQDALLDDLLKWLIEKEAYLTDLCSDPIPEDLPIVENLIEEHTQFEESLRSRQPDFDEATKGRRRQDQMDQSVQGKDMKAKKLRRPVDRGRNPKVQQVSEKFSHVWLLSLDRKRKLDDMLNYLHELRKMRDFNFDDWRRRYTAWMNNKKSRVMDFFRRQDKDGDGKVTREEFIEGILQSKFPTTRLEMNAVADIFDKDRDGYINYREFINALRPDREVVQPKTDSLRIKTEVQRQAQMCTCRKKYEIQEIGEGKYRFGEQLRLVRILRSTVMVRVGGGWTALDEFLVKNDPCRAKGRTNIELREKFILAEGVSQTMLPFKSKSPRVGAAAGGSHASSSSTSSVTGHTTPHRPGPIIKIREKTERSMPMSKTPRFTTAISPHQNGSGGSSADSEVSGILSNSRRASADLLSPDGPVTGTKAKINGSASSRPSSRGISEIPRPIHTSRPPSRAGSDVSDVSLRSHDSLSAAPPTRIPSARKKKVQK